MGLVVLLVQQVQLEQMALLDQQELPALQEMMVLLARKAQLVQQVRILLDKLVQPDQPDQQVLVV